MPTPEQLSAKGTEDGHQTALFAWANMARLFGWEAAADPYCYTEKGYAKSNYNTQDSVSSLSMLFAVPNGGKRDKITASRLKATGVKAGYPDIALDVANGGYHGLRIELKRPASKGKIQGVLKPDQKEWLENLKAHKYSAVVCVGWDQAARVIFDYLTK